MYRLKEIQDSLIKLVGWSQAFNPDLYIDNSLTETESGLYYQGQHPLLTLNNINSIIPEDFIFKYEAWDAVKEYEAGYKVSYNNVIWIAKQENEGIQPVDGEYWKKYNLLSDYIEKATRNGISTMIQSFITKKLLSKETRNILENKYLFDGAGRIKATIENKSKIVGFEITPTRTSGITAKINRIGLQMAGGAGTVHVYVFHSSQVDPVKEFDLVLTGNNGFQWFETPDLFLPYVSDDNNSGGSWYICYNQDDLPEDVEAVNMDKDIRYSACGSCNKSKVREIMRYVDITPFKISAPSDFKDYPELWDIDQNLYPGNTSFGMNIEISVGCDLTDFIINQRSIFADVLAKQVTYNILREITMNPEAKINRLQSNVSRLDILYELDGNPADNKPGGLGLSLERSYKALELDTKGLDPICLGKRTGGVTYRGI